MKNLKFLIPFNLQVALVHTNGSYNYGNIVSLCSARFEDDIIFLVAYHVDILFKYLHIRTRNLNSFYLQSVKIYV